MIPLIILAIEDESSREFMIWLYESSVDRMLREARKYFSRQEDIEDIVSESVVKLVDKVDLLQKLDRSKLLPYAVTTVRHMSLHALQHETYFQMLSFDVLESYLSTPGNNSSDEMLLREQRNARLREIFVTLPVEDRLLLEEKYILLWTDAEIAKTLNIQPNSVRMRLTRAKRRIAKALTEQGFLLSEWV